MKKLLICTVLLAFLILSCSNEVTSPLTSESGKLVLKIDKQNAPTSVVFVKAYLTKENSAPITATLNLLSDSTADLLLNEVGVGMWHLKVDAENDSGLVLYTGEADVEVFAGFISQVYLTLQPTGAGVGSIYINVTWGIHHSYTWMDYQYNPVIVSSRSYYDFIGIGQPVVIYHEGHYKLWYHGLGVNGGGEAYIFYAESEDGVNWTRYSNPVLFPGNSGAWDSQHVSPGAIILENGLYKMYYCGFSNENDNWNVGLAISDDGINWEKYPQPVLSGSNGWEYQIVVSSVIKMDGVYYLYYTGRNLPSYQIGVATSTDGINWTKYAGNPILVKDFPWESNGVLDASVLNINGTLHMVYMNSNASGFGYATSSDGLNWNKTLNNPFFTNQNTSNGWASVKIAYPSFIVVMNETRIYYSGFNNNSSDYKIGFLRKKWN